MGHLTLTPEQRALIDEQLRQMAKICAGMGRDTSVGDKIESRRLINLCLKEIKKIDYEFWEEICPDKKDKT